MDALFRALGTAPEACPHVLCSLQEGVPTGCVSPWGLSIASFWCAVTLTAWDPEGRRLVRELARRSFASGWFPACPWTRVLSLCCSTLLGGLALWEGRTQMEVYRLMAFPPTTGLKISIGNEEDLL